MKERLHCRTNGMDKNALWTRLTLESSRPIIHCGFRWKTVRWDAAFAISGTIWTAVAPVLT